MARESLKGKWGLAVGTFLIYMLILGVAGARQFYGIFSLLIGGPLALGSCIFSLSIARNQNAKFDQLFEGFEFYGKALATHLLMILYILLWALLLIIPGIIKAIGYSMVFFIIADDRSISPNDALKKSEMMMNGHKGRLFLLGLWFFLLIFLSVFTLFIGLLWLIPYYYVTLAKFYDDINGRDNINPEAII